MDNNYVSVDGDSYRITGTRVSLDSIVYDYLSGLSPESIADNFHTLTLEQVYGAITYYLANRREVETYLEEIDKLWEVMRSQQRLPEALRMRLERATSSPNSESVKAGTNTGTPDSKADFRIPLCPLACSAKYSPIAWLSL